jgi:hypothetical protein
MKMPTINVSVELNENAPILPPKHDFYYVDQGNYQTVELLNKPLTIYSDSATSCIIVIVVAAKGDQNTVTLAHLDSPQCILTFFNILSNTNADSFQIIAQGANPPDNSDAIQNASQLKTSVAALGAKVTYQQLFLQEGDPRENNRGDFGLTYHGDGTATATNQSYQLELFQRDPTCGGQTVYCVMRRAETPIQQIRDAGLPFTHSELVELSSIALSFCKTPNDPSTAFTNIVNLQNDVIQQKWSSTPEYEAAWFSDQLKLGSVFAIAMAPVVNLSGQHLLSGGGSFARLRKALLG